MSELGTGAAIIPRGEDFVTFKVIASVRDVVFVKGIIEGHDGLAQVYAEKGGELFISSPRDREAELRALVFGLVKDGLFNIESDDTDRAT